MEGKAEGIAEAERLLAAGDFPGVMRFLRVEGDSLPLAAVARLVAGVGQAAGATDLALAAEAVGGGEDGSCPEHFPALFRYGYACVEYEAPFLAIRPLEQALEMMPGALPVMGELVSALEFDGRHAQAVEVLEAHEGILEWEQRLYYVYNAVMAGSLDKAAAGFARLPETADPRWAPAREKVRRMLARAAAVRGHSPLDMRDVRGWHYVLTGGIVAELSPYGLDDGMNGRWCFVNDSLWTCAGALARLQLVLTAARVEPEVVAVLPDRASRIIGTAAGSVLGLPVTDFAASRPGAGALVVAYDLGATDPAAATALRRRVPGQVLFERATCWTDPPGVTADVCGLLGQVVVPPWEPQLGLREDGTSGYGPADDRKAEEIAAEIAAAGFEPDGRAPGDSDDELRVFAGKVADPGIRETDGGWLGGIRENIRNSGPVPSHRFS